jgi:hypothetical protein
MSQLKVVANISKGSLLTGSAWVDILFGGERVVEHAEITAPFNPDPNQVTPDPIEFTVDYDSSSYLTLTVINSPETIGPIQIYSVDFYLDDQVVPMNWQTAIKGKPMRFGGQPNITITNPHINDAQFNGWCSVPDVSPGMSITWGLPDLVNINSLV